MKKIESNRFGGKALALIFAVGAVIPGAVWLCTGRFPWGFSAAGGALLLGFAILLGVEAHQDNGKVPYYRKHLAETIPFDPARQTAVIRSSVCTGERVAGFRDTATGHFTEVLVLRTEEDLRFFRDTYRLTEIKTEY